MSEQSADYSLRRDGRITIVRLKTENLSSILDVNRVTLELNALVDAGDIHFILDLKNVNYAGSAALGMLLALAKKINSLGGRFILSHPETIEELLRVSRTGRIFETAADPSAALAMLK